MIESIRQKIKSERKSLGFSAQFIADNSKCQKCQVLNFENGKANLTLNTLENICNSLGLILLIERDK